jgi:hypothetical protein
MRAVERNFVRVLLQVFNLIRASITKLSMPGHFPDRASFENLPAPLREPPPISPADSRSFAANEEWHVRTPGYADPEGELRAKFETKPDGSKGGYKAPGWVHDAIGAGEVKRDYSGIRVPVLVFIAKGAPDGETQKSHYNPKRPEERAAQIATDIHQFLLAANVH